MYRVCGPWLGGLKNTSHSTCSRSHCGFELGMVLCPFEGCVMYEFSYVCLARALLLGKLFKFNFDCLCCVSVCNDLQE